MKKVLFTQIVFILSALTLNAEILNKHESVNIPSRTAEFAIRTPKNQSTKISSVKIGTQILPSSDYKYKSYKDYGVTAYAFLFDLSETDGIFKSRRESNTKLSNAVINLMAKGKDGQRFGIYGFSDKFSEISPIPQNSHGVILGCAGLKLNEKNTSPVLFEALSKSISKIGAYKNADRRVVCVLGTGKSSDISYTLDSVIKEANAAGVIICAVGLSDTDSEKPNLQRFASLSKQTGGVFYTNPFYLSGLFDSVETGGKIIVKIPNDLKGGNKLQVELESGDILSMDLSAFLNIDQSKSINDALKEISEFDGKLPDLDVLKKTLDTKVVQIKKSIESLSETSDAADLLGRINKMEKSADEILSEIDKIDGLVREINNIGNKYQNIAKAGALEKSVADENAATIKNINSFMDKFAKKAKELVSLRDEAQKIYNDASKAISQAAAKNIQNVDSICKKLGAILGAKAEFEKTAKQFRADFDKLGDTAAAGELENVYNSAISAIGEAEKKLSGFSKDILEIESAIKDIESKHKLLKSKRDLSDSEKSELSKQDEILKKTSDLLAAAKSGMGEMVKNVGLIKDISQKIKEMLDDSAQNSNQNKIITTILLCAAAILAILIAGVILAKRAKIKRLALEREMEIIREQEEQRRKAEEMERESEPVGQNKYGSIQMIDASSAVYDISTQICRIGRKGDNDISFSNDSVSGYHAEINIKDGVFHLIDLNSTNGTFVNGERIQSRMLKDGDIVELGGEVKFKICIK